MKSNGITRPKPARLALLLPACFSYNQKVIVWMQGIALVQQSGSQCNAMPVEAHAVRCHHSPWCVGWGLVRSTQTGTRDSKYGFILYNIPERYSLEVCHPLEVQESNVKCQSTGTSIAQQQHATTTTTTTTTTTQFAAVFDQTI